MIFKQLTTGDTNALKREVKILKEDVFEFLSCDGTHYDFVKYDIERVIEKVTYRKAKLLKTIQLHPSAVNRHKDSEVLRFEKGTEVIFVNEVTDRVERGLKPLYSCLLPNGNRFGFYPEEIEWLEEETQERELEILVTPLKERELVSIGLGSKLENEKRKNKYIDRFTTILTDKERETIDKYFEERMVDVNLIPEYKRILDKIVGK